MSIENAPFPKVMGQALLGGLAPSIVLPYLGRTCTWISLHTATEALALSPSLAFCTGATTLPFVWYVHQCALAQLENHPLLKEDEMKFLFCMIADISAGLAIAFTFSHLTGLAYSSATFAGVAAIVAGLAAEMIIPAFG